MPRWVAKRPTTHQGKCNATSSSGPGGTLAGTRGTQCIPVPLAHFIFLPHPQRLNGASRWVTKRPTPSSPEAKWGATRGSEMTHTHQSLVATNLPRLTRFARSRSGQAVAAWRARWHVAGKTHTYRHVLRPPTSRLAPEAQTTCGESKLSSLKRRSPRKPTQTNIDGCSRYFA